MRTCVFSGVIKRWVKRGVIMKVKINGVEYDGFEEKEFEEAPGGPESHGWHRVIKPGEVDANKAVEELVKIVKEIEEISEGSMTLEQEYENKTGKCAIDPYYPQMGFSTEYVKWLENKVRRVI